MFSRRLAQRWFDYVADALVQNLEAVLADDGAQLHLHRVVVGQELPLQVEHLRLELPDSFDVQLKLAVVADQLALALVEFGLEGGFLPLRDLDQLAHLLVLLLGQRRGVRLGLAEHQRPQQ